MAPETITTTWKAKNKLLTPTASSVTTAPIVASPFGLFASSKSDPSDPRLASSNKSKSVRLRGDLRKCSHLYWLMAAPTASAADALATVEKTAMVPVMLSHPPRQSLLGRSWYAKRMPTMLIISATLKHSDSSSNHHSLGEFEFAGGSGAGTSAGLMVSSLMLTGCSVHNAPDFMVPNFSGSW